MKVATVLDSSLPFSIILSHDPNLGVFDYASVDVRNSVMTPSGDFHPMMRPRRGRDQGQGL